MTILVRFPDDTYERLKIFICEEEKGVFRKGMIMEYVNRAVLHYMSCQKAHSTHSHKFMREDKTRQLKERVSRWLFTKYNYGSLQNISEKHLKQAIRTLEGVQDRRSVNDRIEALLTCGVKRIINDENGKVLKYEFEFEPEIAPLLGDLR